MEASRKMVKCCYLKMIRYEKVKTKVKSLQFKVMIIIRVFSGIEASEKPGSLD